MTENFPVSKILKKRIDAAVEITMNPEPNEYDKAFMARQLVQVTLPHSSPGNIPVWKRTNGNLVLSIRPGWDTTKDKPIGYPFGTIPRLLLFWITTETLRSKSRKIQLGDSLAGFMRDIGLNPDNGSGIRSDAKRLRSQMERLFRATISFEYHYKDSNYEGHGWSDMQVAPKGELWWDLKNPVQRNLWESWIELGEDFYNCIISAPVPVDKRALRALKNSSLALDLYAWATYKTFSVSKKGASQFIDWKNMQQQLGSSYSDIKDFKRKLKETLRKVKGVYPAFKYEEVVGGIEVYPSKTAISQRPSKRVSAGS
jgi:hypothetical protein